MSHLYRFYARHVIFLQRKCRSNKNVLLISFYIFVGSTKATCIQCGRLRWIFAEIRKTRIDVWQQQWRFVRTAETNRDDPKGIYVDNWTVGKTQSRLKTCVFQVIDFNWFYREKQFITLKSLNNRLK